MNKQKQITGNEIISLQKKLKKDGVTINDALMFIFKEMIDKKSTIMQLQMTNDKGEEIEMNIELGGDVIRESSEKIIKRTKEEEKYSVPMVS